ncbi:ABC transporter ATP-binding protein [Humibacillus xanthopallidus]|uniref:Putative ABC transport system ATP-binding protein n=1 Tax=Humibacillus xanthopallidus TaxID=412689 RepID=A0A543HI53_9MICO|nr:ABC transporter ATP-binding protein [Humibacillus xanthopallidus]TQM57998.1 putative ABC transport system ATP-binding protein [Humibacillus xanthopallidus]
MTLQLDDITLTYPDGTQRVTALERVSLTAQPGTLTAVTGPSGSGKSSLLAVAATLIAPDSGRVLLDGRDLSGLSPKETAAVRRERIGIVFQSSNLLASLTALDQLLVIAHLNGTPLSVAHPRATELLAAVGMGDCVGRRPHQLSGGQRQRVTIARGLMNDPRLLLVDEPTSALDSQRGEAIVQLLRRLTVERDLTTLMVTHDERHLQAADRVTHVVDGTLRRLADR